MRFLHTISTQSHTLCLATDIFNVTSERKNQNHEHALFCMLSHKGCTMVVCMRIVAATCVKQHSLFKEGDRKAS